jgi:hypothetical protein
MFPAGAVSATTEVGTFQGILHWCHPVGRRHGAVPVYVWRRQEGLRHVVQLKRPVGLSWPTCGAEPILECAAGRAV